MAVFVTLTHLGLKRIFRYPWGLLMALVVDPIVRVMQILVFTTLYDYNQSQSIVGYSLSQMIWYFAASSFIWYWIYNFADQRIGQRVIRGDLSQDLLRPVSVFIWELGFAVSLRLSGIIFEFIPHLILYILLLHPDFLSVFTLLRFALAAITAFLLYFVINFLLGLASFYLQNNRAISAIKHMVVAFLAGAYIPLEFFSGDFQNLLHKLPFPYIFYWPVQFFLNRDTASTWNEFLYREGIALLWLVVLFALCQWGWRRAVRNYTDAGG